MPGNHIGKYGASSEYTLCGLEVAPLRPFFPYNVDVMDVERDRYDLSYWCPECLTAYEKSKKARRHDEDAGAHTANLPTTGRDRYGADVSGAQTMSDSDPYEGKAVCERCRWSHQHSNVHWGNCAHAKHAARDFVTGEDVPGRCWELNPAGECQQYEKHE